MSFTVILTDNFNRANTSFGSSANSTNVGNGWIDYIGDLWQIYNDSAQTNGSLAPNAPLGSSLYWTGSGGSIQNGYVQGEISGNTSCVGRFNPTDGSGYAALWYGSARYLYKRSPGSGSTTTLNVTNFPAYTAPDGLYMQMFIQDVGATTVITVNLYDASNLTTPVSTLSYTDSSTPVQQSGYWGFGIYNVGSVTNATIAYYVSGPPVAGSLSVQQVTKTKAAINAASSTGGTGTLTYQYQRSSVSSSTGFSNISGATNLLLQDTGLTPGNTYWYRVVTTDSATPTPNVVYSSVVQITTLPYYARIIGFIGDSITLGIGSSGPEYAWYTVGGHRAVDQMITDLLASGLSVGCSNAGFSGSKITDWQNNINSCYSLALTQFLYDEVTDIVCMLGTNDAYANPPTSTSNYQSAYAAVISNFLSNGFQHFVINQVIYCATNNGNNNLTVSQVNANIQAFNTVVTNLVNKSTIFTGDQSAYALVYNNQAWLGGGQHPNDTGAAAIGQDWAIAFANLVPANISVTSPPSSQVGITSGNGIISISSGPSFNGSQTIEITSNNSSEVISCLGVSGLGSIIVTPSNGITSFTFTIKRLSPISGVSNLIFTSGGPGWNNINYSTYTAVYPSAIEYTESENVSESIVNGIRRLNIVISPIYDPTENVVIIGGRNVKLWGCGKGFKTLPAWIDNNATVINKSCRIINKIYSVSQSNNSYCLRVYETLNTTYAYRLGNIDKIPISTNLQGDVILVVPSDNTPTQDSVAYWMGQTMRLVLVDNEWRIAISVV